MQIFMSLVLFAPFVIFFQQNMLKSLDFNYIKNKEWKYMIKLWQIIYPTPQNQPDTIFWFLKIKFLV